jgi:hypothetical protein
MFEEKFDTGVFGNGAEVLPALPGHRRVGRLIAIMDEGVWFPRVRAASRNLGPQ